MKSPLHALRSILVVALLLLHSMSSETLSAQAPLQRAGLVTFQEQLRGLTDSGSVIALEQSLLTEIRTANMDAFLHLKLGWVSLRLGELAANGHWDDAASEFQFAADLQPTWPWAWYSLGLAELQIAETEATLPPSRRAPLRAGAGLRAAKAFTRALREDPGFASLFATLQEGWNGSGVEERARIVLSTTRALAGTVPAADSLWLLTRARLEQAVGRTDSAVAVYSRFIARYPNEPTALRGYGIALLLAGSLDGQASWYRGLELANQRTLVLYQQDLEPVLSPADRIRFGSVSAQVRVEMVRRFFEKRDAMDIQLPGSRLQEHYQRLAWIDAELATDSPTASVRLLRLQPRAPFDDRALTYLRQGPPSLRLTDPIEGLPPSESWRYGAGDSVHVLHFRAISDGASFARVAGITDLAISRGVAQAKEVRGAPRVAELLMSRQSLGTSYRALTDLSRASWASLERSERNKVAASVAWEQATDRTARNTNSSTTIATAGLGLLKANSNGEVVVSYRLGVAELPQATPGPNPRFPLRIRLHLIAPDSTLLAAVDTLQMVPADPSWLSVGGVIGQLSMSAPIGKFSVRARIGTSVGEATTREIFVEVPDPTPGLGLGPLVIGRTGVQIPFVGVGADPIWAATEASFKGVAPLQLAFQVTGAASGGSQQIEMSVRQTRRGFFLFRVIANLFAGSSTILKRVGFSVPAGGPNRWVNRAVEISGLAPGSYTLRVTITTEGGASVTRERPFTLER